MPRLAIPLSDLQCRTAKTRERAYKLFDGGGMYLFVKPNGVKTWRLRYFKPSGKEGTLIIGNYPIVPLAVARRKRDEAKRCCSITLIPWKRRIRPRSPPNAQHCFLRRSRWTGILKCHDAGPRAMPKQ